MNAMNDQIKQALDALRQAEQQIEYLHRKFGQTGSGNGVLAQITQALASLEQAQAQESGERADKCECPAGECYDPIGYQCRGAAPSQPQGDSKPSSNSILVPQGDPRNWPEDFGHENGQYWNKCSSCENAFIGHKRRVACKVCDSKPVEQEPEELKPIIEMFKLDLTDLYTKTFARLDYWMMRALKAEGKIK